jgi:hypothetical protein
MLTSQGHVGWLGNHLFDGFPSVRRRFWIAEGMGVADADDPPAGRPLAEPVSSRDRWRTRAIRFCEVSDRGDDLGRALARDGVLTEHQRGARVGAIGRKRVPQAAGDARKLSHSATLAPH